MSQSLPVCWWRGPFSDHCSWGGQCRLTTRPWQIMWELEFNPSKCHMVQVTGSRKSINSNYRLHVQVLETVICSKHLGIDISSGLSWGSHVNRITARAYKASGFIQKNIKTKHPSTREMAYNKLVRPHLEYAVAVWDPHVYKTQNLTGRESAA